jgi:hypothetical protein
MAATAPARKKPQSNMARGMRVKAIFMGAFGANWEITK